MVERCGIVMHNVVGGSDVYACGRSSKPVLMWRNVKRHPDIIPRIYRASPWQSEDMCHLLVSKRIDYPNGN